MRNIFLSILISLMPITAIAKTEGNYLGANIFYLNMNASYALYGGKLTNTYKAINLGADYKHAWNFNNFFIAPGIFFDYIDSPESSGDVDAIGLLLSPEPPERIAPTYRYGAKLNLGYDVTNRLAVYFTNGLAVTNYKNINYYIAPGPDLRYRSNSRNNYAYFYGAGLSCRIFTNFNLSLEYNRQSSSFKVAEDDLFPASKIKSDIDSFRLGIGYHF